VYFPRTVFLKEIYLLVSVNGWSAKSEIIVFKSV